ncbi:unnamed protein product, partial [Menidia menidia]
LPSNNDPEDNCSSNSLHLLPPCVTFYRVSNGASFGADQQLLDQLKEYPHFHLKEAKGKHLDKCQIILVFCIINTRIESDVEAAMEQIPESAGDKPVILVVMHHTRDIDFFATKKKWKKDYEQVQLDVEVLFHRTEEGLLKCEKNQQAVEEILSNVKHIRNKVYQKWLKGQKRGTERGGKEKKQEDGGGKEERKGEGGGNYMKKEVGGKEEQNEDGGEN